MQQPFLLYRKMRPIKQKALRAGCAQIGLEEVLRTQFGAAKCASTLKKCSFAERACTLCSYCTIGLEEVVQRFL